MVRNKCADMLVRELVVQHGVTIKISPDPEFAAAKRNVVKLQLERNARKVAVLIDYNSIDHAVNPDLAECVLLRKCAEKLLMDPVNSIFDSAFCLGGDTDAR